MGGRQRLSTKAAGRYEKIHRVGDLAPEE